MAGDPSELLKAPVSPRLKSRVKVGGGHVPLPKREPAPSNIEIADDGTHRLLQAAGLSAEDWRITKLWGSATNPSFSVERRDGFSVSLSADELDEVLNFPSPLSVAQRGPQDPSRACPEGAPRRSYLVALGDMQFGKALKSTTPILTANRGWTTHGDLKVGDRVFGADGKPKRVLDVLPTARRDLYEVTLGDGTVITASDDHEWSGWRKMHPANYRNGGPSWEKRHFNVSTLEMKKITEQAGSRPFVLTETEPIEFPEADLPIEPHLLGLWLGDGNSHQGVIIKGYEDADLLLQYGYQIVPNGHALTVSVPGLAAQLRAAGLLKNKHIPEQYLYASIEQRLALVQGLMDTDGYCNGYCEFSNTSERIIDGMKFLLHSLGIRFTISEGIGKLNGEDKKRYWRIIFRTTLPVFTLRRKLDQLKPASKREGMRSSVVKVEHVGQGEAQCITVEDGLYLAGEELVVTHNCENGEGIVETIERTMKTLDEAYRLYWWYAQKYDITEVVVSFLGDHVEGFVSQGGANAWRTPNTLTEQIRVTRRIMLYAMQLFATLGIPVRMVAIPGNHGEAHRFNGRGVTRYDDSHDTECLISVSDAAKLNPEAFGHVSFYVPETDELSVALDLNGTLTAFTHGHMMKPGKYHEWVKGQAYNRGSIFRDVDAVFLGHWHHGHYEESSDRVIVIVPTLETGSQWWKHATGEASMQGLVVATLGEGRVDGVEFVRT